MTVSSPLPLIDFSEKTDPGRDPEKQINEDACGYRETPFGHLCVICDGMGGHAGGRDASTRALNAVFEVFGQADSQRDGRDVLREAVIHANRCVVAMEPLETYSQHPGSTLVALLHHQGGTDFANVGDSRGYWIHASKIVQVTKDHSMVQQLVEAGALTPTQAAVHPEANKIYRALGIESDIIVEMPSGPIAHEAGDLFVLCSDGLSDRIEDSEILDIVSNHPPEQATHKLVDLANARGGHDNISIQIVRAREPAQPGIPRSRTLLMHPYVISHRAPARLSARVFPLTVVLAFALAGMGLILAFILLARHLQDRRGHHHHEVPSLDVPQLGDRMGATTPGKTGGAKE